MIRITYAVIITRMVRFPAIRRSILIGAVCIFIGVTVGVWIGAVAVTAIVSLGSSLCLSLLLFVAHVLDLVFDGLAFPVTPASFRLKA